MTQLTEEEITAFSTSSREWTSYRTTDRFWQGRFWPSAKRFEIAVDKPAARGWVRSESENVLRLDIDAAPRKRDFADAAVAFPGSAADLALMEEVLTTGGFEFADLREPVHPLPGRPLTAEIAMAEIERLYGPAHEGLLRRLALLAEHVAWALDEKVPGLVLVAGTRFFTRSFVLDVEARRFDEQTSTASSETDRFEVREIRRFTPPDRIDLDTNERFFPYVTVPLVRAAAFTERSTVCAAVIADMALQGVAAAVVRTEDGGRYVVGGLSRVGSMKEGGYRLAAVVGGTSPVSSIGLFQTAAARHRFIVVGGEIVASSPYGATADQVHSVAVLRYSPEDGPTAPEVSFEPADERLAAMRELALRVVGELVAYRSNWVVDIEFGESGASLADVGELLSSEWYAGDATAVRSAVAARQKAAFRPPELNPTSVSYRIAVKASTDAASTRKRRRGPLDRLS